MKNFLDDFICHLAGITVLILLLAWAFNTVVTTVKLLCGGL
jgi:hypothetical protein